MRERCWPWPAFRWRRHHSLRLRQEAVAIARKLDRPVALKAEALGLLHKSDLGCVKLNCKTEGEVIAGYDAIVVNAKAAGFTPDGVLVQPMVSGVAECFAGIIDDPLYSRDAVRPRRVRLSNCCARPSPRWRHSTTDEALRMIQRVKGAQILSGAARPPAGRPGDARRLLVNLGRFAVANAGRFRALDLQSDYRETKRRGCGRGRYRGRAVAADQAGSAP